MLITVNRSTHEVAADPKTPLLQVLRNDLTLTGAHYGCGIGRCGACVVLADGEPIRACTTSLAEIGDRAVTTIEGLAVDGELSPLQQAFVAENAAQCGYCLSGILLATTALLAHAPAPTRAEIDAALDEHICRCGSHVRILRAITRATNPAASPNS